METDWRENEEAEVTRGKRQIPISDTKKRKIDTEWSEKEERDKRGWLRLDRVLGEGGRRGVRGE